MAQGSLYTDEQRRQAVVAYSHLGNMRAVHQRLGIPEPTLSNWKREEWWSQIEIEVRSDVRDEIAARTLATARKCMDAVDDRLDHGDTRVTKHGTCVVPISARDAAVVFAIMFDKRQLLLNRPTSISESRNVGELASAMVGAFKAAQERSAVQQHETIEGEVLDKSTG